MSEGTWQNDVGVGDMIEVCRGCRRNDWGLPPSVCGGRELKQLSPLVPADTP